MENILTPEEANKPVTYGELMAILTPMMEMVTQGEGDISLKNAEIIRDYIIKIRDNADYKRQRDLRFMINLIAQMSRYDKEVIYSEYFRWCEEFDKLNKPKASEEKKDEQYMGYYADNRQI